MRRALRELGRRRTRSCSCPSHRSYLDPLVLAGVLRGTASRRNHVLGGINMAFWPIGPLAQARRASLHPAQRSATTQVYKLDAARVLRATWSRKRFNLEWYIEGGRSRTGKLRPPRYGLLAYLVRRRSTSGDVDDVYLVPVSIAYDQLQEVGAMAAEAARRRRSRAEGLRLAGRLHCARSGRDVGTRARALRRAAVAAPRRWRDAGRAAARGWRRWRSRSASASTARRRSPRRRWSTLALLGVQDRALTLERGAARSSRRCSTTSTRAGSPAPATRPARPTALRDALAALVDARRGRATTTGGAEPVYSIAPDQHLVAAFYRNACMHFFLNRAIIELVVLDGGRADAGRDRDEAWAGGAAAARPAQVRVLLRAQARFARRCAPRRR